MATMDNTGSITSRLRTLSENVPLKILIVDDDEIERLLIGDRLNTHGLTVLEASDGREALALIEKEVPPVLLVDWQMPQMSGIELTERLRARGVKDTYIIMLTARDSSFDYERGYQAGVDDYLTKKVSDVELFARIHSGFSTYGLRRALRQAREDLAAR